MWVVINRIKQFEGSMNCVTKTYGLVDAFFITIRRGWVPKFREIGIVLSYVKK